MLEESERMIADNNKRLGAAVHELRELIVGLRSIFLVITPPSSRPSTALVSLSCSHEQIQSKADPALSEAQELLNAEEEMEAATI